MTVIDNAEWHIHDAQTFARASTHIALYYVWLINNNFLTPSLMQENGFSLPLPTQQTPGYYFEKYADYKLISDDFTLGGQRRYANTKRYTTYLEDSGNGIIEYARNQAIEPLYNILDSWDNVAILDDYFNTMGFILGPRRLIAKLSAKLDAIEHQNNSK